MSEISKKVLDFTGERYVPEETGNIALEHLHRYLSVCPLAKNKTVLDIACGEGYGSALLSEHASQVIGIDIDIDTVIHAGAKYVKQNLKFTVGDCVAIPLADNSVDIIVSFETIEHHAEHERMMCEFKRVLRADGALIISSPDKKNYSDRRNFHNKFHVKELYEEQFRNILSSYFRNYRIFEQRIIFGSAIFSKIQEGAVQNYLINSGTIHAVAGIQDPYYQVAVASDGNLPALAIGILEQPINESEIIGSWEAAMAIKDATIDMLKNEIVKVEHDYNLMLSSNSWKLTKLLRDVRRLATNALRSASPSSQIGSPLAYMPISRFKNGIRYLLRGDIKGLLNRLKFYRREQEQRKIFERTRNKNNASWGIISTPHTLFIANAVSSRLAEHGIGSEVMTSPPEHFEHDFYMVLCAQMFDRLPPADKRIVFQLEQSVSSRWFTERYFNDLENSFAVFDYSLKNIEFLQKHGISYPHIYYLPIGLASPDVSIVSERNKEYDFLFYGDSNSSPRRRKMLSELARKFNVKIYSNLFGEEMHKAIQKAKIVINLHYYDGALLETPRIQECISLGVPVLSEGAVDQDDYPELSGAVRFFEEDSIEDMLFQAEDMLRNIDSYCEHLKESAQNGYQRFSYMFDRALVALGFLSEKVMQQRIPYLPSNSNIFALSLPETISRRLMLMATKPQESVIFDAARFRPGWLGCGMSFNLLANYALAKNLDQLTVFEDDVELHADYRSKISNIHEYLESRKEPWDVFSGIMAEVHPDTRVLSVDVHNGVTYITINRMVSMVYNIYNKSALNLLARWDSENHDVNTNVIDRYLQNIGDLKVVVSLPFLVGHREELHSTLWGIQNDQYSPMIAHAESRLNQLAEQWLLNHGT
ncbi:methyltransferase domain-containing protein [Brucella sp. BO2]|uniref:methyltransferase domain-containing protein n=1 Tax=Brucella sp. BO2 TaxID=693750 RepID=UPI0018CB3D4D|nr:methyltransferase domain-containing protein [Brucella sp. BO2]QPN26930.1 methyltransferase domain-containing protein [Brucella sp. BO2]